MDESSSKLLGRKLFAWQLDSELFAVVKRLIYEALRALPVADNAWVSTHILPEIDSALYAWYYGLSLCMGMPSAGMRAMGLKPDSPTSTWNQPDRTIINLQRKFGCLVAMFWVYSRFHHFAGAEEWRAEPEGSIKKKFWKILQLVDFVVKISSITNSLAFLVNGQYPSLIHRFLSYRMAHVSRPDEAVSSLEIYRMRILSWEVIGSLLAAVTVMRSWDEVIYIHEIIYDFTDYVTNTARTAMMNGWKALVVSSSENNQTSNNTGSSEFITADAIHANIPKCGYCQAFPCETPHYLASCGHVYCYLCLPRLTKISLIRQVTARKQYICRQCRHVSTQASRIQSHSIG